VTTTDETIEGVALRDVAILLYPTYVENSVARPLVRRELLAYDDDTEEHRRTPRGDQLLDAIRAGHGLNFVDDGGGGRWHLNGRGLHCGDALEILLVGGTWLPVRFEVTFGDGFKACNGRLPRFYVSTAGGSSLKASVDQEQWEAPIFRWPPTPS
jgi:hypothetical protein